MKKDKKKEQMLMITANHWGNLKERVGFYQALSLAEAFAIGFYLLGKFYAFIFK